MRTEGTMCRAACLAAVLTVAGLGTAGEQAPASTDAKILADLADILRGAEATELIDINIMMRDQVSQQLLDQARIHPRKADRRAAVIGMLKPVARAAQADLLDVLRAGQQEGKVGANLHSLWLVNMVHAQVTPDLAYEIAARPDVRFVALDHKAGPEVFPVEPIGGPIESTGNIECGVDIMNAPDVWNTLGITGQGVTVCVIDTGCCITHPDLANQIWTNPGEIPGNNIDDDSNGFIDDVNGWSFDNNGSSSNINDTNSHGTHVSGTVGGDGTNGTTTGMAPDVAIMTAKFYNSLSGEVSVWNSMQYAVDNGADVITASLGWAHSWNPDRPFWRETSENTMAAGLVVIFAAGNEGGGGAPDDVRTPGDVPDMITVGATDCNDNIASFSSRGPVTWQSIPPYNDWPYPPGKEKPTIVAPGVSTVSTSNNCSGYSTKSGTSMATPHVAGAVALILEANPDLDHWEVKQLLKDTATFVGSDPNTYGAGRVDAFAAVESAMSSTGIRPDAFSVNAGVYQSGSLSDLFDSDDSYLVIRQRAGVTPTMPVAGLEVTGTSNTEATELSFTLEASAGAVPANSQQRIELFNYDANGWEQVDQRNATNSDSVVTVTINTNPSRFIQAGTREVRARLSWLEPGDVFFVSWTVNIDQTIWSAVE